MAERGKARYSTLALGSNATIASAPGTLYAVVSTNPSGSSVRLDDSANLGATPDLNAMGANTITIVSGGSYFHFGPGIGFNTGLSAAATSNARVTIVYE